MQVILAAAPALAAALQDSALGDAARPLHDIADEFATSIEPLHADAGLGRWFAAEVPDERAESLASRLRELEGVESAYTKPPARLA